MTSEEERAVNLDDVLCLDDLEKAAKRVLVKQDYDYYAGGGVREARG